MQRGMKHLFRSFCLHLLMHVGWRDWFVQITLVVTVPVADLLANFFSYLTEIYEVVSHVDQLRCSIRSKARNLHATSLVGNRVHGVHKIFITRNEDRSVISSRERQHIHCYLDIEIGFARAVIERFQFLLHDTKTVATHPEQKPLLSLGTHIHS